MCFLVWFGLSLLLGPAPHVRAQTPINHPNKVDDDGDGLIEIWTLTDLDNVRHNLSGTSYKNASGATGDTRGCPNADHDNNVSTPHQPICHGYELMNDLDFTDSNDPGYTEAWDPTDSGAASSAGFPPIGSGPDDPLTGIVYSFSSTFEGNGHTISNLFVHVKTKHRSSERAYAGLFGFSIGKIRNLGVTGQHMSVRGSFSPESYVGGLVGYLSGEITGCYATGDVFSATVTSAYKSDNSYAGGLVGYAWDNSIIKSCYATGNVEARVSVSSSQSYGASSYAGGLVGHADRHSHGGVSDAHSHVHDITITNCYATGDVTSSSASDLSTPSVSRAGGLIGYAVATIRHCHAEGDVNSSSTSFSGSSTSYAGGLVGDSAENGVLTNCYATGGATSSSTSSNRGSSTSYAGGLAGVAGCDVANSYALGSIQSTSSSDSYSGGLVGHAWRDVELTNCYWATGTVSSTASKARAGGLSGHGPGDENVTACYYSGLARKGPSGSLEDAPQVPELYRTEEQLKALTAATSGGWSEDDWNFGTNMQLPTLDNYVPSPHDTDPHDHHTMDALGEHLEELEELVGGPTQDAAVDGSVYQRIKQLVADMDTNEGKVTAAEGKITTLQTEIDNLKAGKADKTALASYLMISAAETTYLAKTNASNTYAVKATEGKVSTLEDLVGTKPNSGTADSLWEEVVALRRTIPDVSGKADIGASYTKTEADEKYALKSELPDAPDLSDYVSKSELPDFSQHALKSELPDISRKADVGASYTKAETDEKYVLKSELPDAPDLSGYLTTTDASSTYATLTALNGKADASALTTLDTKVTAGAIGTKPQSGTADTLWEEVALVKASVPSEVNVSGKADQSDLDAAEAKITLLRNGVGTTTDEASADGSVYARIAQNKSDLSGKADAGTSHTKAEADEKYALKTALAALQAKVAELEKKVNDGATGTVARAAARMETSISVRPNPASDRLIITSPVAVSATVIDASGRLVLTRQLSAGESTIDVGDLVAGSYVLVLQTDGERPITHVFVKQ